MDNTSSGGRPGGTGDRHGPLSSWRAACSTSGGRPVGGALLEIWRCDAQGLYDHPRGRGDGAIQRLGLRPLLVSRRQLQLPTLKPVAYQPRAAHPFKVATASGGR
jgi:protocatechuate 3,4-dioxygenase beta subunit